MESASLVAVDVTHRKDGNSADYPDRVTVFASSVDSHAVPDDPAARRIEDVRAHLEGRFVMCAIGGSDAAGRPAAAVSLSGQGGY